MSNQFLTAAVDKTVYLNQEPRYSQIKGGFMAQELSTEQLDRLSKVMEDVDYVKAVIAAGLVYKGIVHGSAGTEVVLDEDLSLLTAAVIMKAINPQQDVSAKLLPTLQNLATMGEGTGKLISKEEVNEIIFTAVDNAVRFYMEKDDQSPSMAEKIGNRGEGQKR
jgi:hypothetical protein